MARIRALAACAALVGMGAGGCSFARVEGHTGTVEAGSPVPCTQSYLWPAIDAALATAVACAAFSNKVPPSDADGSSLVPLFVAGLTAEASAGYGVFRVHRCRTVSHWARVAARPPGAGTIGHACVATYSGRGVCGGAGALDPSRRRLRLDRRVHDRPAGRVLDFSGGRRGASRREVQKLIAARHPDPDWHRRQSRVRPVAAGLSRLEMTVPDELLARIEAALDLDSHIDPGRDVAALLERALAVYIEKRTRRRFAMTGRPGPAQPRGLTKRVPAASLRAAYQASAGQCEYVSPDGRRCTARAFLEVNHVVPRARGGRHDQIRILCRSHNQRAAEIELGKPRMDEARRRATQLRELRGALVELGYSVGVAGPAADAALAAAGEGAAIEALLADALRHAAGHRPPAAVTSSARAPGARPRACG